ncbi:MAG: substrate-binding domain-containing protein, partial [Oscillospiraceae bacterium]
SALYSMHITVPQDVAVIGLSNIELSLYTSPPLTTLEIPARQIGIAAVDTIEKRINGSLLLPQKIFFPTVIIPRESV